MRTVYCVGCKNKIEITTDVIIEEKQTSKGTKYILRTTCPKGHKVCNMIKKE